QKRRAENPGTRTAGGSCINDDTLASFWGWNLQGHPSFGDRKPRSEFHPGFAPGRDFFFGRGLTAQQESNYRVDAPPSRSGLRTSLLGPFLLRAVASALHHSHACRAISSLGPRRQRTHQSLRALRWHLGTQSGLTS